MIGALTPSLAAGAQQAAKMYRIAMLAAGPSACPETSVTRAFRRGLAEAGYTEERDFILDRRCFPTDDTAAPVAADLLKQRPTVFVAAGHPAAIAVKNLATVPGGVRQCRRSRRIWSRALTGSARREHDRGG
jgi:hypothetical protein